MKKIAKLSLVAAVAVLGFTTANADTLAEAFAASKIKGEVRAQYFGEAYETVANKKDSDIYLAGGSLGIITGTYNGFGAGATFYTSHILDKDDESAITKTAEDASGSVMSEAYLTYGMNNTTVKVGRQTLATPLLASSGSRLIKDSFEGALIVNTDLANTTIAAGYIDKYASRTDSAGSPGTFDQISEDGAYTAFVSNKSIENLTLTAQYATIQDATDTDVIFTEASYKLGDVTLAGEYLGSDNGANTASNGTLFGAKVNANVAGVALTAAYTTTDDEANVVRGLGEGAYPSYTKLTVGAGANSYIKDTNSYLVAASYKISDVTLGAGYAAYDLNATDTKKDESEITVAYALNKNTSLAASQSFFGKDDTKTSETRVNLSYKF